MIFSIENEGKSLALFKAEDRVILDTLINGESDEGVNFRMEVFGRELWDGLSPFSTRPATADEEIEYEDTYQIAKGVGVSSGWYLRVGL